MTPVPPGQGGLAARLDAIERRIAETQRAIPAPVGSAGGLWVGPTSTPSQSIAANAPTSVTGITESVGTPTGCSYTSGQFVPDVAGVWLLVLSVQWGAESGGPYLHWTYFRPSSTDTPRYGGGQAAGLFATATAVAQFDAGERISTVVASAQASSVYYGQGSCRFSAIRLFGM